MAMGSATAGGSAPAGQSGQTKAKLNVYKPIVPPPSKKGVSAVHKTGGPEKSFEFDYNPKEMNFTSEAVIKTVSNNSSKGEPQQQVVGAKGSELTFELFFSVFEVGGMSEKPKINDLVKLKNDLLDLTRPHKDTLGPNKTPSPPLVDFSWGDMVTDPGLVKKVTVTYTRMLPNGKPVCMKSTVVLMGTIKEQPGTNPTSGGRSNRKVHTLVSGESLASVAFAEFNDAALWRAIAEENEIDDPMRLTAGSVLLLPAFEE